MDRPTATVTRPAVGGLRVEVIGRRPARRHPHPAGRVDDHHVGAARQPRVIDLSPTTPAETEALVVLTADGRDEASATVSALRTTTKWP